MNLDAEPQNADWVKWTRQRTLDGRKKSGAIAPAPTESNVTTFDTPPETREPTPDTKTHSTDAPDESDLR